MRSTKLVAIAALSLAACFPVVDTEDLPPIDDYETYHRVDATGEVSGHGDTYRIIYVNDIARAYVGTGEYPLGSVIVKEMRKLESGGPGALDYISIARKLDTPPSGGELNRNWLFTKADTMGGDESYLSLCWNSCHQAAPFDGLFLNYSESLVE